MDQKQFNNDFFIKFRIFYARPSWLLYAAQELPFSEMRNDTLGIAGKYPVLH